MLLGFYYYTPKNRITSNDNYVYFSTLFDLLAKVEPSIKFKQKNNSTRSSVLLSVRPNLDFYEFFVTNFLKHYRTENVKLLKNSDQIFFIVKSHILIFKDLPGYDMELYEEKFDDPFVLFVKFDRSIDPRLFDLIV